MQNTTAAAIEADMEANQMLGDDIPEANQPILVAPESTNTSPSFEHNQSCLIQ